MNYSDLRKTQLGKLIKEETLTKFHINSNIKHQKAAKEQEIKIYRTKAREPKSLLGFAINQEPT